MTKNMQQGVITDQHLLITGASVKCSMGASGTKEQESAVETADNNGNPFYAYKFVLCLHFLLKSYMKYLSL
jgi:hypothetical protein